MKILVFCLLTLLAVSVSGILKFPRPFDGMESGAEDHSQNRDSQAVDEKDIESIDTKWDTEIDYGRCSFKQQFDTFSVALSSSRHGPWKDESNGCDYPWDDIPSPFHVDKVFTLDFVAREDDIVVNHNGHHFYTFKTGSCCGEIRSMEISGNIEVHAVHALSR
ncbi:hypothetical protein QR680_018639 [Steinernema hermaphroditum]|uniref:Galectin n=1 Tax=Steinernema hermaphroditum TaxID=289476 RepID=A0AA39LRC2_9BILA|nr:hypothetical protein QR680_018639 [Steinernema hermaphroditum]